jgi:putrescine transport system ATP-binding protein
MDVSQAAAGVPSETAGELLVQVESIRKTFGDTVALDSVNLDVKKGEMFALLGASGSGKTTLLRLLAGFEQPDQGRVVIDGRDMTAVPPYDRPVNMMFQSYALFPHMTVGANVAFGLRQERGRARLSRSQINQRTKDALHLVRLEGFEHRRPHQLSGGQQQRVALARAIVKRPKLLLLDEPLAALDRKLRELTQIELVRIQAETGITFIIVTHDQEEAMSLSERMAVLHNGRVAQVGPPRQIYEFPSSVYVADFIGTANLLEGRVTALSAEGARLDCAEIGGIVVVAAPPQATQVGDTLHVALRPERIAIALRATAATGAPNEAVGTVRDMAFLGNQSRVAVELKSGKLIIAVQLNPGEEVEQCQAGTAVRLSWSARDCRGLVS